MPFRALRGEITLHRASEVSADRQSQTDSARAVGQTFVRLLTDHPWFELRELAASERSAGRPYREATRWIEGGGNCINKKTGLAGFFGAQERTRTSTVLPAST